jgi:hypothetical protein
MACCPEMTLLSEPFREQSSALNLPPLAPIASSHSLRPYRRGPAGLLPLRMCNQQTTFQLVTLNFQTEKRPANYGDNLLAEWTATKSPLLTTR